MEVSELGQTTDPRALIPGNLLHYGGTALANTVDFTVSAAGAGGGRWHRDRQRQS